MEQYIRAVTVPNTIRPRTRATGVGTSTAVVRSSYPFSVNISSGTGSLFASMDPGGGLVPSMVNAINGAYEFYKIRSASIQFLPNGGTGVGGVGYVAFVDNPELLMSLAGSTYGVKFGAVTNAQNNSAFSVAFPFTKTYSTSRQTGRKIYSVNATNPFADANTVDRSIQMGLLMCFNGVTVATSFNVVINAVYEFSGLGFTSGLTLVRSLRSNAETPVVPYYGMFDDWPGSVVLRNRDKGDQEYVLSKPPSEGNTHGEE